MSAVYTNSVLLALYALKLAKDGGLPVGELCAAAEIDPSLLQDPDSRVPSPNYQRLLAEIARRAENELFFLRPLQPQDLSRDNVTWYYYMNARNVREAGVRSEKIYRVLSDAFYPSHHASAAEYTVRISRRRPNVELSIHQVDFGLSQWGGTLRYFTGPDLQLKGVRLAGPHRERIAAYEEFFQVPVEIDRAHHELVYDPATPDLPNRYRDVDPNLDGVISRVLEPALASLTYKTGFIEEVSRAIQGRFIHGNPAVKEIAARLGMSSRTFQRRLSAENQSFSELLQVTRRSLAEAYLKDRSLNITEIALLLGFSDTAYLTKAFRNWCGMTPSEFRRQHAP